MTVKREREQNNKAKQLEGSFIFLFMMMVVKWSHMQGSALFTVVVVCKVACKHTLTPSVKHVKEQQVLSLSYIASFYWQKKRPKLHNKKDDVNAILIT